MTPLIVWIVTARLCWPLPAAPEGFACERATWTWREGEAPQIEDTGHPDMVWRDLDMRRVEIPARPPRRPPGWRNHPQH